MTDVGNRLGVRFIIEIENIEKYVKGQYSNASATANKNQIEQKIFEFYNQRKLR